MFSHVFFGVSDFDRAYEFYSLIMQCLSIEQRFIDREKPWAGWQTNGGRPLFVIAKPYNGESHQAGNGQMVAFQAPSREVVKQVYEIALSSGGKDEGAPRLRSQYHADYYGAYFRDPDGNKICVVCHLPVICTP